MGDAHSIQRDCISSQNIKSLSRGKKKARFSSANGSVAAVPIRNMQLTVLLNARKPRAFAFAMR